MRTIPIVTIAAIAIASTATAYYCLRDNDAVKRADEAKPAIGSISPLQVAALEARLRTMETAVSEQAQRQAVAGPDKPVSHNGVEKAQAHKRLTLLPEQVAALEARLRTMETAVSEQAQRRAVSGPDKPVSHNGAENAQAKKLSEADFAHWMDAALDAGDFDRDATESVMEQAETSLAAVPGINLAGLQCSERFCRATLISETGQRLDISQLIGASPFMGSGTIVNQPDGTLSIYFVQPGQSFSELRSEAQEAALGASHLE